MLAGVFSMFPLTLEGLGDAMAHLSKGAARRRAPLEFLPSGSTKAQAARYARTASHLMCRLMPRMAAKRRKSPASM